MVLSNSEPELSLAAVTLAELVPWLDKDFEALPDNLLVDLLDDLPDNLLDKPLEVVLDAATFSSCSCLSVWHSKMLWPLHLQWVHFFPLSCFFFALPELLAKYNMVSPLAARMWQLFLAKICEMMFLLICFPPLVLARTVLRVFQDSESLTLMVPARSWSVIGKPMLVS